MNEKTKKWMAELALTPEYYAEGIALDLILACEKRRGELGLSYAELARRMGVSRQRINTLMSGTQNATIGSLVKLAIALECKLEIGVSTTVKKPARKTTRTAASVIKAVKTGKREPKRRPKKPQPD